MTCGCDGNTLATVSIGTHTFAETSQLVGNGGKPISPADPVGPSLLELWLNCYPCVSLLFQVGIPNPALKMTVILYHTEYIETVTNSSFSR